MSFLEVVGTKIISLWAKIEINGRYKNEQLLVVVMVLTTDDDELAGFAPNFGYIIFLLKNSHYWIFFFKKFLICRYFWELIYIKIGINLLIEINLSNFCFIVKNRRPSPRTAAQWAHVCTLGVLIHNQNQIDPSKI